MIVTTQSRILREENSKLLDRRIAAAMEDKAVAKSQGDLSENFGYVEAMKEIENLRRMQADLGLQNSASQLVNPLDWCAIDMEGVPRVMVGAMVEIDRDGTKQTVLIGGAWDAELENDKVVPYSSPLGQAIIPKQPGFKTVLETSGETITVVSARTPTKEEIEAIYWNLEMDIPTRTKLRKDNETSVPVETLKKSDKFHGSKMISASQEMN